MAVKPPGHRVIISPPMLATRPGVAVRLLVDNVLSLGGKRARCHASGPYTIPPGYGAVLVLGPREYLKALGAPFDAIPDLMPCERPAFELPG